MPIDEVQGAEGPVESPLSHPRCLPDREKCLSAVNPAVGYTMCSVPSGPFSRHVRYGLRAGLGWAQRCCSIDLHQERRSRTRSANPSARSWLASLSVLSPHPRPPRRGAVRVRGRRRVLAAHERWQCWHPRCTLHYVPTQLHPSRRWPAELKDGAGWRTDHQGPSPAQAQARLKGKRNTRTQNPHRPNAPGEARTSTMPIAARRATRLLDSGIATACLAHHWEVLGQPFSTRVPALPCSPCCKQYAAALIAARYYLRV